MTLFRGSCVQSLLPYLFSYKTGFFFLSRKTANNLTSPMKFCYNTSLTPPKQSQRSRSILKDGSRFLGLFWKETMSYNQRFVVVVVLLFYVHGKHLRSCRGGQLT